MEAICVLFLLTYPRTVIENSSPLLLLNHLIRFLPSSFRYPRAFNLHFIQLSSSYCCSLDLLVTASFTEVSHTPLYLQPCHMPDNFSIWGSDTYITTLSFPYLPCMLCSLILVPLVIHSQSHTLDYFTTSNCTTFEILISNISQSDHYFFYFQLTATMLPSHWDL